MSLDILQEKRVSLRKVISGTSLIAGTTIGAGMLGIPLVTADAGFFPAVCASLGVWAFMVLTGLLYVEVALSLPAGANIFTMAGHYLGTRERLQQGGCSFSSTTVCSWPISREELPCWATCFRRCSTFS